MKYYIIFGPPGAGKGTQSQLLAQKYSLKHISTGQLLRDEIAKGSEIGLIAKKVIDNGEFVEDSIVLEMIRLQISDPAPGIKGFIFDGFPRTINQAKVFDTMLAQLNNGEVNGVLSLEVKDSLIVERIQKRARIEGREDDSSIKTILSRIKTYHNKTEPLISFYKRQGKYFAINGDQSVEEITENIGTLLEIL